MLSLNEKGIMFLKNWMGCRWTKLGTNICRLKVESLFKEWSHQMDDNYFDVIEKIVIRFITKIFFKVLR